MVPVEDKLRHFYVFSLIYLGTVDYLTALWSLTLITILAISVEIIQRVRGGRNTLKENLLDIAFSILGGLLHYVTTPIV